MNWCHICKFQGSLIEVREHMTEFHPEFDEAQKKMPKGWQ